jgi:cellulose biosynthesis protein BcsQ
MSALPGVIVVAEHAVWSLLREAGINWNVQARVDSIAAMWDGLNNGTLSPQSKILVFSDSLQSDPLRAVSEREKTAGAIVAMSRAGAEVFIAVWQSDDVEPLRTAIEGAAAQQGIAADAVTYTLLPIERGGREVLDCMRVALGSDVVFPDAYDDGVDRVLTKADPIARTPAPAIPAAVAQGRGLPSVSSMPAVPTGQMPAVVAEPLFGGACAELLSAPKKVGQVTITVTSSKGGSGKSTAALLLGASIARSSREGGNPLSVCVIDMDTRDGQIASLIGTYMPTALNIRVQPVWDETTIRRHVVHESSMGIDCLLAPIRPRTADTVGPDFYRTIIRSLQRMYDVVVIDTSVQYLDPLIAQVCLPEATEIIFITTLAATAVQGMARALREITSPIEDSGLGISRDKLGILVNQSVAGVGMQREQILAAGLGVPVVGVIPLATKDVLTATNLHRMSTLLDHPLIGPAYNELARTCIPDRGLVEMHWPEVGEGSLESVGATDEEDIAEAIDISQGSQRRGMFRRG